jgi:hypothetical protein
LVTRRSIFGCLPRLSDDVLLFEAGFERCSKTYDTRLNPSGIPPLCFAMLDIANFTVFNVCCLAAFFVSY